MALNQPSTRDMYRNFVRGAVSIFGLDFVIDIALNYHNDERYRAAIERVRAERKEEEQPTK